MVGQSEVAGEAGAEAPASASKKDTRERSGIEFPYGDLEDALQISRAIFSVAGNGSAGVDQVAGKMNQTTTSGAFRSKLATARMFGLLDSERGAASVRLTDLGLNIVDETREAAARADAFLNVPLYRELFEKYRGNLLPPAAALERQMNMLGVPTKQTDRARQAFERSARQAGYFDMGANRLVKPGRADVGRPEDKPPVEKAGERLDGDSGGGGGRRPPSDLHPFVQGLLDTLPKPDSDWPSTDRAKWLQTAANIFDLIYKGGDGGIVVQAARAERSPRPGD